MGVISMKHYQEIIDQNKSNMALDITGEKEILASAIEQSSVGILMTDLKGYIIYANDAMEDISQYKPSELIGNHSSIIKSSLTKDETYKEIWQAVSSGEVWSGDQESKRKDGTIYYEELRVTPIYDKNKECKYYLSVRHDITERKELEKELQKIAMKDCLTNCYNRSYLMERLDQMLDNYKRVPKKFSLVVLDIDHFKNVNDQYGHLAGDMVLVELVKIINKEIRSYDIFGRYGGEEFILILPDTDKEHAYMIINRIRNKIKKHIFIYENNKIKITFSAGIAEAIEIDKDKLGVECLISLADSRMYNAKECGRNEVVI